jgi:hypothetical protein
MSRECTQLHKQENVRSVHYTYSAKLQVTGHWHKSNEGMEDGGAPIIVSRCVATPSEL